VSGTGRLLFFVGIVCRARLRRRDRRQLLLRPERKYPRREWYVSRRTHAEETAAAAVAGGGTPRQQLFRHVVRLLHPSRPPRPGLIPPTLSFTTTAFACSPVQYRADSGKSRYRVLVLSKCLTTSD